MTRPIKILFICKADYTNKNLIEDRFGRLYHIPIELRKLGMKVKILAIDYKSKKETTVVHEGVSFTTIPLKTRKIVNNFIRSYKSVKSFLPDIIIASGDSHIGFFSSLLASNFNCKFFFDIYDYYPAFRGNRIPGMKTMFKNAIKNADLVICASIPLMKKIKPIAKDTLYIPNGVDTTVFHHIPNIVARETLAIENGNLPIIGYFGSITPSRGPLLIEACELLRNDYPNLKLMLAGINLGIDLNKDWINYYGQLPQKKIPLLICACNVVTIPYAKEEFNDYSGACKIPEYLSCKIPTVATDVSNHKDFFSKSSKNSIASPNAEDIKNALKYQIENPETEVFDKKFLWKNIALKLYDRIFLI